MRTFSVVYLLLGSYHRYRCVCNTKWEAKKYCHDAIGIPYRDIVEVFVES